MSVTIPADAVDGNTSITVTENSAPPPPGTPIASGLYTFGPDGKVFAHPLTVTLPVPAGLGSAAVYWSRPVEDGGLIYENIGGVVDGGFVTAQVVHFSSGAVGPASSTRTLTGSQVIKYNTVTPYPLDGGGYFTNVASDYSQVAVNVWVPVVDDGGFTPLPGTAGLNPGTFDVGGVPTTGGYWLQVGNIYAWIALDPSTAIDMGYATVGRPDAIPVTANSGGNVTFNLTDLAAWDPASSGVEALAPDVNDSWFAIPLTPVAGFGGTYPDAGDTAFQGLTLDLTNDSSGPPSLIQGSLGDTLMLGEIGTQVSDAGFVYSAMQRVYEPARFDEQLGGNVDLTGAFDGVSADRTLNVHFDVPAFEAMVLQDLPDGGAITRMQPPASAAGSWFVFFDLQGMPGGTQDGVFGSTSDLCFAQFIDPHSPAIDTGTMTYGFPSLSNWGAYLGSGFFDFAAYQLPGTNGIGYLQGPPYHIGVWTSVDGSTSPLTASIEPVVGPVQAPTISGLDFTQPQTGIGLQPTLSWQAPAIGAPNRYDVFVHHLYVNANNGTADEFVGELVTPQTTVTLPPGLLVAGESYVFAIEAEVNGYPQLAQAPLRSALPEAAAVIASDIVEP